MYYLKFIKKKKFGKIKVETSNRKKQIKIVIDFLNKKPKRIIR